MASIEKRVRDGRTRWYARYRTPDGIQRSRSFDLKRDAADFLSSVENSKLVGTFVDSSRSKVTVGACVEQSSRTPHAHGTSCSATGGHSGKEVE